MNGPTAQLWIDAWDPAYLSGVGDGGPAESGGEPDVTLDLEVPADAWCPMPYPAALRPPAHVLLVDGVRRNDAVVWTGGGAEGPLPGIAASYAAGVVHCDLREGTATLAGATVRRGLFTASTQASEVTGAQVRYPVHAVKGDEFPRLDLAVQWALTELEIEVADGARQRVTDPEALLVLDGALKHRTHLPRTIGYLKSHRRRYLPPEQSAVVTALAPGQRSPVFKLVTSWPRYTWYLRLPGGSGAPWSGLIRAECSAGAELSVAEVTELADLSVVTLPRFAARAYKDPRAPQNLVPIAGLEQRLRAQLGHVTLLRRALSRAAARTAR